MNNRFIIICTGFNCAPYVYNCINSIVNQTYQNWTAVLIDDASDDQTIKEMRSWKDSRLKRIERFINTGAAKNRFEAINKFSESPEDIILLLGMDDRLQPNALERINQEYEAGKLMTYGNWKDQFGEPCTADGFNLEFSDEIHAARDYRKDTYRSTAPNTFRRFLFDKMTDEDFKVNGQWIKATTESPLMFACLEMCGKDRIGVIQEPIYIYNKRGSQSTKKRMGSDYQNMIYQEIIKRPKFDLI